MFGLGISQSGRFLRHFLAQGFNADEEGRQVFDGLFIHVAGAGVGSFNHRFAQPSRDAQPVSALFYPTDLFPFTDLPETDPETGARGRPPRPGRADRVVPKIFTTNTSYEYWGRAASLVTTSPDGKSDVPIPEDVRVYSSRGCSISPARFLRRRSLPEGCAGPTRRTRIRSRGCGAHSSTTWTPGCGTGPPRRRAVIRASRTGRSFSRRD